jgi:hypothetical protein
MPPFTNVSAERLQDIRHMPRLNIYTTNNELVLKTNRICRSAALFSRRINANGPLLRAIGRFSSCLWVVRMPLMLLVVQRLSI